MEKDHGRKDGGAEEKGRKSKWVTDFLKRQSFANIKAFADILCW